MSSKYATAIKQAQAKLDDHQTQDTDVVCLQRISKKKWEHSNGETYKDTELIDELSRDVPGRVVVLFDATSLPTSTLTPKAERPESITAPRDAEALKKETIDAWNEPEPEKIDENPDSWKL